MRVYKTSESVSSKKLAPKKAVHLTMITTMGLSDNPYAWDVQSVVTMDDLFVL